MDLHEKYRHKEKEDVSDEVEFEIELIRQVEINIDYILMLVERYQKSKCKDKEILVTISQAIKSSPNCRSKQDLIEEFIKHVNVDTKVKEEWQKYVVKRRKEELDKIIESEKLKPEPTMNFIINSFRDGVVKTTGTDIDKIMPPISRFGGSGRSQKKRGIIEKLLAFFDRFFGLGFTDIWEEPQKPEEAGNLFKK